MRHLCHISVEGFTWLQQLVAATVQYPLTSMDDTAEAKRYGLSQLKQEGVPLTS